MGDISKLPITKTGYVRQLCRDECFNYNYGSYSKLMKQLTMTVDEYKLFKEYLSSFPK